MESRSTTSKSVGQAGLVGRTFGSYHVLSLIQRGGMGEIYLADLEPQKIKVVLKRLQDAHTADERYVEMFRNEAAVMSGLEHPNIVKVLGVPVIENCQCLVMEFVRGRNLQQVLKRLRKLGRALPPPLAVHLMRKVLLGLHEAHQASFPDGRPLKLVHRDVKPGNILISFAGDTKITDFGIAKSAMQNRHTTAGVVKGTVRYLSPEQIRSEDVSLHSDLFSCASVLVEILTDQPLFDRGAVAPTLMAILNNERAPIDELLPFRCPELSEVLERALSPRPERRHGSALELSQALGQAGRSLGRTVGADELGALLRQLFQGSDHAARHVPSGDDVTYLIANDAPSTGGRNLSLVRGSQPLDADAFVSGSSLLPQDYLDAEARARRMLQGDDVVFENPIELGGLNGGKDDDDLDLDLDLDDLDIEDEEPDPAPAPQPRTRPVPPPPPPRGPSSARIPLSSSSAAAIEIVRFRSGVEPSPASSPSVPLAQLQGPSRSGEYAIVDRSLTRRASLKNRAASEWLRPRLVLLLGCLVGVLMTCAVLALGRL